MTVIAALAEAARMAFIMFWKILWPLVLGFALSGFVQGVVSKREMVQLLPDDSPRSLATACGLGAASSSCSYAAVALARSVFRKGANFTAAMAFQLASTNLVAELTIIMVIMLGWQFALAEFLGGPLMVALMAIVFRLFLPPSLQDSARQQAEKGAVGKMEGHAAMDMSVTEGPLLSRVFSVKGMTAASHYFVMDWAMVWKDIVGGVVIAGALAAWVPRTFWSAFFLSGHPQLAKFWGPVVGPVVAILSFVCSVGNIPLATVLWNGGISFGGVIAFIFADLLVLPILNIYRKYYGWRVTALIVAAFYASMVAAALAIEFLFQWWGLVPHERGKGIAEEAIKLDYTSILNIIFLVIAALMVWRFFVTGGPDMMREMGQESGHAGRGRQRHGKEGEAGEKRGGRDHFEKQKK
ncbi:MAG TPA: permease [Geomonas sp.]|nr:permease [Geomonas sp.]